MRCRFTSRDLLTPIGLLIVMLGVIAHAIGRLVGWLP